MVPTHARVDRDDHRLATHLATLAGHVLMDLRTRSEPADLGSEGDRVSNARLRELLADARPDDAVLSEESVDSPDRLARRRVWIIDPLDGTREYAEGRSDWAVHVALVVDGQPVAGAVALPASGRTLSTELPGAPAPRRPGRLRVVVSRTRPPAVAAWLAERLDADIVPMGSAGAKVAAVVLGEAELYVHAGGQYEWDSAAPVAVARSYGLHASRVDGAPLVYNRPVPWLPDLLVCRPELAEAALAALRAAPP
jgi:3'(2'), 5'-bisphosphate nucleotidase